MSDCLISLSKPQITVFKDKTRFRVLIAGRRFGKSYLSAVELLRAASRKNGALCYYVAPTYKMAKKILWRDLKKIIPRELIEKKNETELTLRLVNGSEIVLIGSQNYDDIRGVSLSFVVLDEFAMMEQEAWEEAIRPALSDQLGGALFISTPKGFNWAYETFQKENILEDWKSFKFTTLDGGRVTPEEIESAKIELSPKKFLQEYMASFETIGNRAYYAFDRSYSLCETEIGEIKDIHIGMDFNVTPMSAVICLRISDQIHVVDEISLDDSNTTEMCQTIQRKYPGKKIITYPDPAGNQRRSSANHNTDFSIIKEFGFMIDAPKSHPPVEDRVENVNRLFLNARGESKLFINKKCKNLIKCLEGLTYKEGGERVPNKSLNLDHMPDALGYLCWQLMPPFSTKITTTKAFW